MKRLALAWLVLTPALALAQEPEASPEVEEQPTYRVHAPPTRSRQRVSVEDRFDVTLQLGKRAKKTESGYTQSFEDTWLPPDQWRNQLDAQRVYREATDLSGKLTDPGLPGFELRWGLGPTGLYYCHKQSNELSELLFALLNTERPPGGIRQGSLDLPAGLIPATPVQVGQDWEVDPVALARWGRVFWGSPMIPQPARGWLAAVKDGKSGPVLELRWSGKMTVSEFHPPEVGDQAITRPTSLEVDAKLLQPTKWEVDGDPYVIQTKAEATVTLEKGERYRVERRWRREVRRLE